MPKAVPSLPQSPVYSAHLGSSGSPSSELGYGSDMAYTWVGVGTGDGEMSNVVYYAVLQAEGYYAAKQRAAEVISVILYAILFFAMPAPPTNFVDELPQIDINEASHTELIELKKENSDLTAAVSKKQRGNNNALGYKSQVVGWAKKFLLLRALFIDHRMFCAKPTISMDPATIFVNNDLYSNALTVTLYKDILMKFHSLSNNQEYAGLAKDFIREHGDGCSSLILTIRKALPSILKNLNTDADLLTTANTDRRDNPTLGKLLKFPNNRKPALWAPVLFPGPTQDMTQIFMGPAVFKTRFVLSPDKEWASTGAVSGIDWEEQYRSYHKMLTSNMHLPHVRGIFKTVQQSVFTDVKTSPGTTGSDQDNATEDDIVDAMHWFKLGTDSMTDEDDGDVVVWLSPMLSLILLILLRICQVDSVGMGVGVVLGQHAKVTMMPMMWMQMALLQVEHVPEVARSERSLLSADWDTVVSWKEADSNYN
ncbi:hypothetical protein DFH07DRAFT_768600 [Mycena maculata]|uniref:Uncharacterized protein n=1 Tax=Mycena maculata TaxID=230809 RepID=A0AAD7NQH6_9AGAR|nr:hypothetical protein DFH07DRAFT_768600 [Mycena maculata]